MINSRFFYPLDLGFASRLASLSHPQCRRIYRKDLRLLVHYNLREDSQCRFDSRCCFHETCYPDQISASKKSSSTSCSFSNKPRQNPTCNAVLYCRLLRPALYHGTAGVPPGDSHLLLTAMHTVFSRVTNHCKSIRGGSRSLVNEGGSN